MTEAVSKDDRDVDRRNKRGAWSIAVLMWMGTALCWFLVGSGQVTDPTTVGVTAFVTLCTLFLTVSISLGIGIKSGEA